MLTVHILEVNQVLIASQCLRIGALELHGNAFSIVSIVFHGFF